jgi:hypothetical protein
MLLRHKPTTEALARQLLAGTDGMSRRQRNRFHRALGRAGSSAVLQEYYRLKRVN